MSWRRQLFLALAALLGVLTAGDIAASGDSSERIINVRQCGARGDGIHNDRRAIQSAIDEAIKAGPGAQVFIPRGRYLLDEPADDHGSYLNILRARDLIVKGEAGATLLAASPRSNMIYLWDVQGLRIDHLVLDRARRMFSQMTVESVDVTKRQVVVKVEPGYDPLDAPNLTGPALLLVFSDPASGSWGDHGADCSFFAPGDRGTCWPPTAIARIPLGDGRWRLTLNTPPQENYVNARAALWVIHGGGDALTATASGGVVVEDVEYHARGADAGFYLAGNNGPFTFKNFSIDTPPGASDLVAAQGGSYVLNNHTALSLDHVRIVKVWDDAVNIGANFAPVFGHPAPDVLVVDGSRANYQVGDKVQVWDWTLRRQHVRSQAVLTRVVLRGLGGVRLATLTFNREVQVGKTGLPSKIDQPSDGVDHVVDVNSAGTLKVKGSEFQSFHSHGILMRASHSEISGSLFRDTIGPGIQLGPDFLAQEGPASIDVSIKANTFSNVSSSNITIGPTDRLEPSFVERDNTSIRIDGNHFLDFGRYAQGAVGLESAAVYVRNATDIAIVDNRFCPFHRADKSKPSVDIALSSPPIVIARNQTCGRSDVASQ